MSVVAPASASMDPAAQPLSLGPLSVSSSRPIVLAIRAMAVRGVMLGSCHIGAAASRADTPATGTRLHTS
jgi:hypothetical protein